MSRLWFFPVAVVGVAVLLAVATAPGGGINIDGPVVAHDRGWGLGGSSGMDARVGGPLEYDDGCLRLNGDAVVWPDGTRWAAEQQAVRLDDGSLVHIGDTVFGGGGMAYEAGDRAEGWKRSRIGRALARCLTGDSAVVLFNATADLDVDAR